MALHLVVHPPQTDGVVSEQIRFQFDQSRVVLGRRGSADVILPHDTVSGTHATVRIEGSRYELFDEQSTNGTRVNGKLIAPGRGKPLRSGDVIDVGIFRIDIDIQAASGATSAADTRALAIALLRQTLDTAEEHPPRITIANGPQQGQFLNLPKPPSTMVVGRDEKANLRLVDADSSREHAVFYRAFDGVYVRDLGSKNGVEVGGCRVSEARLSDRDEVRLGNTILVFEEPALQLLTDMEMLDDAKGAPAPEPTPEPPSPPVPAPMLLPAPRRRAQGADIGVYVLAAVVVAFSLAGLVWLMQ